MDASALGRSEGRDRHTNLILLRCVEHDDFVLILEVAVKALLRLNIRRTKVVIVKRAAYDVVGRDENHLCLRHKFAFAKSSVQACREPRRNHRQC